MMRFVLDLLHNSDSVPFRVFLSRFFTSKKRRILSYARDLLLLFSSFCLHADSIAPAGFWLGTSAQDQYYFDAPLIEGISDLFTKDHAISIVDFGCGDGKYQEFFLKKGFYAEAYDGNPDTPLITQRRAGIQDLSIPFDLGKQFDWVISLEVGEHLPQQFERIFIENLIRHTSKGIVLSWAVPGQGGHGHVNEQSNEYIKKVMDSYGWYNDVKAEKLLRKKASIYWFKNTIMVFRFQERAFLVAASTSGL